MTIDTNAIRERANLAAQIAPGEWYADHTVGVYAHGDADSSGTPAVVTDPRADLVVLEHIAGLDPQTATALADEIDAARAEIADAHRLRQTNASQAAEIARLTAANQRLLNRLHAATPDLVTAQQRADQAEDRATDLANRLHRAEQEIASHGKAVTAWANQVDELKKQLAAEERQHGDTVDDRDQYQTMADQLAEAIARMTGVDIGEHSSMNNPWENALQAATEKAVA